MSSLREYNLERGKPSVDLAIRTLTFEIRHTRDLGYTVLKIIHGYGSSGAGGRIRVEARAYLSRLKKRGQIRDFIPGEEFSIFTPATLEAFRICGDLRQDRDLERHNNGVTYIIL